MHISSLGIVGVGPVDDLELKFKPGINVIAGINGTGKTTVLAAAAQAIGGGKMNILQKLYPRVGSEESRIILNLESSRSLGLLDESTKYHDRLQSRSRFEIDLISRNIIDINMDYDFTSRGTLVISDRRMISRIHSKHFYARLNNLDLRRSALEHYRTVNARDAKFWLSSTIDELHNNPNIASGRNKNLEIATSIFTTFFAEEGIDFSFVSESGEVYIKTASGEMPIDRLSTGYHAVLSILLGIIINIDKRFNGQMTVNDFKGIVIIDEIEQRMHPRWQARVIDMLRGLIPKAQILISTHSPHVVQSIYADELIALHFDNNYGAKSYNKFPEVSEFGFMGWTIEEILKDVMELEDIRSPVMRSVEASFYKAVDEEDVIRAGKFYAQLNLMLHPNSKIRKSIEIEYSSIGGRI